MRSFKKTILAAVVVALGVLATGCGDFSGADSAAAIRPPVATPLVGGPPAVR